MTLDSANIQSSSASRAPGVGSSPGRFGAIPERAGVRFRVFAPAERRLRLHLLTGSSAGIHLPLEHDGMCEILVAGARAGDRYGYTLDDSDLRPDPASRFQPDGVHGPSEIVDPNAYHWRHESWSGRDPAELVIYEVHVGTFTERGTFAAARERLPELRDLGITAIELMPIADFAGARNWGYDGAALYAPSRAYGHPDDLRALVDAAHGLGIAVILDVVYNHLGPEGAYLTSFYPGYITERHHTPWGGAVNLDGPGSHHVRGFIVDNALHWAREYRLDGLRLDATHALIDDSPTPIVAELVDAVRAASRSRMALYAEDHRNLVTLVEPRERGGWGLDGVWADDFHHIIRRMLAGDEHGYYEDFDGSCEELALTIHQGWLFSGQATRRTQKCRGTDASQVPMKKFVVCLQNHDQIGNRATGDRLHHTIDAAAWRAASTILLTAPMTPLLFMGQEWAASTPFQYFTDLEPALGRLVTEGRRREFREFPEFADPQGAARIPDPQAIRTFENSRLKWSERDYGIHAATLRLYTALLHLRHAHAALASAATVAGHAVAVTQDGLVVVREERDEQFWIVARLRGAGAVSSPIRADRPPQQVLSTEEARFAPDPQPPAIDLLPDRLTVHFQRPGAVIFRAA